MPVGPAPSEGDRGVLALLLGDWRLRRRIVPGGRWHGRARFRWAGPGVLEFDEAGLLRLETGATLRSGGAGRLTLNGAGVRLDRHHPALGWVPTHDLSFAPEGGWWVARATHVCAADRYDAEYRVRPGRLVVLTRVRGPRKAYRSLGVARRAVAGPGWPPARGCTIGAWPSAAPPRPSPAG